MKTINWAEPDMGEEEANAAAEAVRSNFVGGNGPSVREFEAKFARKLGLKYALAVCNGTMALICAMQAMRTMGITLKFIVPTFTFFATGATAVEMGLVKLVDVDRYTWNISTDLNENRGFPIVIPVDICGLPVNYDSLKGYSKYILADSAESIGSKYKGEYIGSQADIHTFSLHASKVITTGEGGMITTENKETYEILKSVCNQGYESHDWWLYTHDRLGFNYRMSEVHAAIGLVQLKKLDRYIKERTEKARIYKDLLEGRAEFQEIPRDCVPNYFLLPILVEDNEKLCRELKKEGISTKCVWTPLHQQAPTKMKGSFPNAEYIASHGMYLPIGNRLGEEDVKEIADIVSKHLRK